MTSAYWQSKNHSGVFASHGNHSVSNCCSQTNIIITTTAMVDMLLNLSMDVHIESIVGVESFTVTM